MFTGCWCLYIYRILIVVSLQDADINIFTGHSFLYVYRIGKLGELVVEGDNNIMNKVTGTSMGTFTVLELNPQTTKFYVGGVPSDIRVSNKSHLV